MNPITDIVFSITWVLLLVWAIRTISRGWNIKSNSNINGMWTTKVTKVQHPEMVGVKPGEELMGVTFSNRSCDLEDYKDLQERIEQLKEELEDEDDDGDIVVRA
tara:strand:+ start:113 stop:424 length:312 start_codon:yes stop_codon:yes gene_type:complete